MSKYNKENELKKREYYKRISIKKSEKTVRQIMKAVENFEEFTGYKDFRLFNMKMALDYLQHLRKKSLSINTIRGYLRELKNFLEWLSDKPSYKSRIRQEDIELLSITNNETNQITKRINLDYPTFEQAKQIIESIEVKTEVDRRDKALISFTLLTGIRAEALMTLSLGCINIDKMLVTQFVKNGVKTKFRKDIVSKIFNFDDNLLNYFVDWFNYLREKKLFGNEDPLFPKGKNTQEENNFTFVCNFVEKEFWQAHSSIRNIFIQRATGAGIKAFSPHKYRHLAIKLAFDKCKNAAEIKAISQSFGHEDVSTTIQVYGNYRPDELSEILDGINSNQNDKTNISAEEKQALNALLKKVNNGII